MYNRHIKQVGHGGDCWKAGLVDCSPLWLKIKYFRLFINSTSRTWNLLDNRKYEWLLWTLYAFDNNFYKILSKMLTAFHNYEVQLRDKFNLGSLWNTHWRSMDFDFFRWWFFSIQPCIMRVFTNTETLTLKNEQKCNSNILSFNFQETKWKVQDFVFCLPT